MCWKGGLLMDFFIKTYGVMATLPFLSFFLIYFFLLILHKTKKQALNIAIYITSILLLSAVASFLKMIFDLESGLWLTILWVVIIFIVLGFMQWKIKGFFNYKKIILSTLKLSFLTFGVLYILFFIIGLTYY